MSAETNKKNKIYSANYRLQFNLLGCQFSIGRILCDLIENPL